jgi:hypothetical protein
MDPSLMVGTWSIERDLLDRATGQRGAFIGTLIVTPNADGFDWSESGQLTWARRITPAFRHLALCRIDGQWWMTFADGRQFHPWVVGDPVVHPCAEDTYRGLITIAESGPDGVLKLRIVWDVDGPEKDQQIITRLRRGNATDC